MGNGAKIGIIAGAFLFLIIGLPVLFASCGGSNPEPVDNTPAPKESVTLEIWNLYDEEKAFKGSEDRFKTMYSGDMNITFKYTTFTNEEKYEELLIDAMAAGGGPDIFAMHHSWLPRHKDKISPMPEYLFVPGSFKEQFIQVVANQLIIDGVIYGVPMYVNTLALFYNKQMFELIKPASKIKPGETWDDIKEQARALSEPDQSLERFKRSGIAMGRADNIRYGTDILQLIMAQIDIDLYDDENVILNKTQETGSGEKVNMGTALSLYTSFDTGWETLHESWNEFLTARYPEDAELGAFVRQKTAMIFGYPDTYEELGNLIKKYEGIKGENPIKQNDIGISEVPQIKSSDERRSEEMPITFANFYPLTVSIHSQYPDLAWEFLVEASGAEGYEDYNKVIPGRPTALQPNVNAQSSANIDVQRADKIYGPFAKQVQFSRIFVELNALDFEAILSQAIDRAKKRGIEKVLNTANTQLQCVLDKTNNKLKKIDEDCLSLE
jgi:ABC-type glycerol-3-phosphate transport system substrate-binding protein